MARVHTTGKKIDTDVSRELLWDAQIILGDTQGRRRPCACSENLLTSCREESRVPVEVDLGVHLTGDTWIKCCWSVAYLVLSLWDFFNLVGLGLLLLFSDRVLLCIPGLPQTGDLSAQPPKY
jgi:hypothetical protein